MTLKKFTLTLWHFCSAKVFNNYPHIRLVESEDTAEEAQRIFKNNMKGIGAIASKEAAEMYNLSIFASSIQTIKNNVTRFVILNNDGNLISKENINKAALKFILIIKEVV